MELKKIKDIFSFEKGSLQSTKSVEGQYDFITASSNWKTHNSFDYDCEALIVAVAASGSLGRVHYANGKFISSDLCFILKPKDSKKFPVNLEFFYSIFKSLKEDLVKSTATGTAKKSINKTNFGNYVIPYYNIEEQNRLKPVFEKVADNSEKINFELSNQKQLLSKLKQSILKEAIAGKLTADWRKQNSNTESASELLGRIKTEKNQLIKEKQIKKEKTLPPITENELPYELPKSWTWCRLGAVSLYLNGKGFDSSDFQKSNGVKCIKITNAGVGEIVETDDTLPNEFKEIYSDYLVYENDIVIALTRPYIKDGLKVSLCPKGYNESLLNQRVAVIKGFSVKNEYIYKFLRSDFVLNGYKEEFDSKGQQPNLKTDHITNLLFPLPPFEEQKAIVEKVETLMLKCQALEEEIKTSEANAQMLMQAVLKEAFEDKKEEVVI